MKLKASEVQKMLDVPDDRVIAYGYTHERNSIEVYFW